MINCVFAEALSDTVTECRNHGKSHMHRAANAYCTRCKVRVPIQLKEPPVVERLPEARQMTIEEYLRDATA